MTPLQNSVLTSRILYTTNSEKSYFNNRISCIRRTLSFCSIYNSHFPGSKLQKVSLIGTIFIQIIKTIVTI